MELNLKGIIQCCCHFCFCIVFKYPILYLTIKHGSTYSYQTCFTKAFFRYCNTGTYSLVCIFFVSDDSCPLIYIASKVAAKFSLLNFHDFHPKVYAMRTFTEWVDARLVSFWKAIKIDSYDCILIRYILTVLHKLRCWKVWNSYQGTIDFYMLLVTILNATPKIINT